MIPPKENEEMTLQWNPQWLKPLRVLARQVLRRSCTTIIDVDELVNVAWEKCVINFPPEYGGALIMTHSIMIKGVMRRYVRGYHKAYHAGCKVINASHLFTDPMWEHDASGIGTLVSEALADPHDYIASVDLLDLLQVLRTKITHEHWDVVLLLIKGYTFTEIQDKLNIQRWRVSKNLQEIRVILGRLLDPED